MPATRLFQATLPGRKEAPTPALPGVEGPGGPQITALRHQTTTCRSFSALLATLPNVSRVVPPRDPERPASATLK